MKKGFIHLIPVLAVALVLSLTSLGAVAKIRTENTSNVLSSSNSNRGSSSENKGPSENSGPGNSNKEEKKGNSSQEKSNQGSDKSQSNSQKEIKTQDQQKNKNKIEVELELEDEEENEQEATGEASPSAGSGLKIRTNFPITVNPLTNEKIVTTPSGVHIVILPEVAIQNMIKAGFPVVLPPEPSPAPSGSPEATPSATPEGTPSASPEATVEEGAITLTEVDGQLVYEIPAVKRQKFLAVIPVDVRVTGLVSAESGDILKIKKSLLDQLIDLLSI